MNQEIGKKLLSILKVEQVKKDEHSVWEVRQAIL